MRAAALLVVIAGLGYRRTAWLLRQLFLIETSKSALHRWVEEIASQSLNKMRNRRGQILMSPARLYHSAFQGKIIKHLFTLMGNGEAFPDCAISTTKGTKDVVWCSLEKNQE